MFLFMAAHSNGQAIVFLPYGFFYLLSSIFFFYLSFSSPNLSSLPYFITSTHGVALVMQV